MHSSAHIAAAVVSTWGGDAFEEAEEWVSCTAAHVVDLQVSAIASNTTSARIEAELEGIGGVLGCQLARMSMR